MNRYVITRETIKGREYMISALYDENKKMIEVLPESTERHSILGNIYIARVENIVRNLNAAFVRISPEEKCYLPLEDLKHPIFTKKISTKSGFDKRAACELVNPPAGAKSTKRYPAFHQVVVPVAEESAEEVVA